MNEPMLVVLTIGRWMTTPVLTGSNRRRKGRPWGVGCLICRSSEPDHMKESPMDKAPKDSKLSAHDDDSTPWLNQ